MDPSGFPGPPTLGRGLVVGPGAAAPAGAQDWPRVRVDADTLAEPQLTAVGDQLDRAWRQREPVVVELAVPLAAVKEPETCAEPPYELDPSFGFARERLHFLIWANRYDGRSDPTSPQWHHANRAIRLGAAAATDPTSGDVELAGGMAWIDGGPRTSGLVEAPVVHMNQLLSGSLAPDRAQTPRDELASDQLAAVSHAGGAARVLAPAGSGKTRVLTARLRHLLVDRGWAPATLTALAYNTRAAGEMRSRTTDVGGAQVRTLHAFGYEIIGRSRGARPRLLDEREVRNLLEPLVPVKPRANDDVYAPYLESLAQVRAALDPPDDVEQDRDDIPDFASAFARYRERLDELGAIDFDEQIYSAIEVLLRDPDTRRWAQDRCCHMLVDELQDLTPAQLLLIRLLSAPAHDVFGVGDDDQVIYGYAGADPRFLVDYQRYFPGAASYLLEVNYRCPADVVGAATNLLSYNRLRVPKAVRAGAAAATDDAGAGLTVERHDDDQLGARLVEVVETLVSEGAAPADVAVLTRVNAGLLAPQVLLAEAGVPIAAAVDERMLDRTGMRAALAWLRLALAAADRQPLRGADLAVVARRPSRSLSPGLLKALGRGDWGLGRLAGFAADLDDARLRNGLSGLHEDLDRLGQLVRSKASTADLLAEVRDTVGLGRALGRLDQARSGATSTHTDDLDALVLVARAHPDPSDFEPWLRRRLRDRDRSRPGASADEPSSTSTGRVQATADGVTLSTVHRVKGLEWPHVIVWDASDGVMPHRLSATGFAREEERRVFHVALTRGRRSVTVLARAAVPSPFLAELAGNAPHPQAETTSPGGTDASGSTIDGRRRSGLFGDEAGDARSTRGRARSPRAGGAVEDAGPEATRRGELLREWRRQRAKEDGVPAYVILHDRHLDGVARRSPTTLDELAGCDGIGPTKLDRYGDDILAVLADADAH
ncbi:MAG: ATP-dependent DNA helicase UvrD2 [Acidimicrobiales bacterium]